MYISSYELLKMTLAIISIMISCLVAEGSQWFFLYFKLCIEIQSLSWHIFKWCLCGLIGTEMSNTEVSYLNLLIELQSGFQRLWTG